MFYYIYLHMKDNSKRALIFGILCCLIFATFPYILDIIWPSKSIAQKLGENVIEILDTINGSDAVDFRNRKKNITGNILIFLGFIFFFLTIYYTVDTKRTNQNKWYLIVGVILAVFGLAFFILYIGISLITSIISTVLAVVIILFLLAGAS